MTFGRVLAVTGLVVVAGGAIATAAWYRSAGVVKVAVAPGSDSARAFLQSIANSPGKVSLQLMPVGDNQAALAALRSGQVQLASVRVDENAGGDIRAVAVLSSRYLVQNDVSAQLDADLAYAQDCLANATGKPINLSGLEARAGRRLEVAPRGLVTRSGLKLTDEQADKLWFLGAGRDDPEEADDWRARALLITRMLVTSEKIDRQVIHDVAMLITDGVRATRAQNPTAREVTLAPIDDGKGILRAHDGIARFVNREGQGFFERYGDLVYVGMSVLGVVLTAVGGFFAWLRYRLADNGRRHLSRMQVLVRWATSRPDEAARVTRIAGLLGIRVASDVSQRKVAYDVLSAIEILQKTLGLVLETRRSRSKSPD